MDTLDSLLQALSDNGADHAYFKLLAANDNWKNQFYVGGSWSSLHMLPFGDVAMDATEVGGSKGRARFKCAVDFSWITPDGRLSKAPGAQLILYPRYPEIRLSSLIEGAPWSPKELLKSREPGRALVLGTTPTGMLLGYLAGPMHPITRALRTLKSSEELLEPLSLPGAALDPRGSLIAALRRIHRKEWIESRRLTATGSSVPCNAENCGGYTLEAELGITPNGYAEPDFLGWEVKQFGSKSFTSPNGVLTLMTPEPDGGVYGTEGAPAFIRRFGYADTQGRPDRINFGGTHYFGKRTPITGLTLQLPGYDPTRRQLLDGSRGIELVDDVGVVAASWSYAKLMEHWRKKHARAVFLASQMRKEPRRQYKYGPTAYLGTDANFETLLHGFASGAVYYDPGIKIEAASTSAPRTKKRSQFRVRFGGLKALYGDFEQESLA